MRKQTAVRLSTDEEAKLAQLVIRLSKKHGKVSQNAVILMALHEMFRKEGLEK